MDSDMLFNKHSVKNFDFFHFVLLLSPHHHLIANCFPLIIILTNQHIAKVIKPKPEPYHLQKQRFHVPPMMFVSASFPSGNK